MNTKQLNIEELEDGKPYKEPSKLKKWFDKTQNNIHYYCWKNPKRIVYNFWYFRKEIYYFRDFDYTYNFDLFIKSLERTANTIDSNEVIVNHKETADSIRNFCKLYKRYINDGYIEEAGCNWDNISFSFEPIEGSDLLELKSDSKYSEEEMKEFYKKADILRKKDFGALVEEFKKFETWWD